MPPKKKEVEKERPLLGRFKNNLKMGIVGLPNVGKSTLFNCLTKLNIPAENFPFCTIEPNLARVHIPDERFTWLVEQLYKPKSSVSAFLDIVDIAGLVKGAAQGEGLGNAFLSNISQVDGIFHVCRAFEDADVTHVEDRVDPVADLEIIHNELRLKDIAFVEGIVEGINRTKGKGQPLKKEQEIEVELCGRILACLQGGTDVRFGEWSANDIDILNTYLLLTAKPVVYLINLTEQDYARKKNKWLIKIHEWVKAHGGEPIIPFSGALEFKLLELSDEAREQYCKDNALTSALEKITKTGFKTLQLIYYFTVGETEVKCWQIRKGTKAPQAAGVIHTDFERGFICGEIMRYEDLRELGTESAVKAGGKYRQQGREYVIEDGDICLWKFNVTTKGK